MALTKEQKDSVIEKYRKHENDSGSPEVQIALLTEEIKALGTIPPEIRVALDSRPDAPAPAFQPEEVEA